MRVSSLAPALGAACLVALAGQARAEPTHDAAAPQPLVDATASVEIRVEVSVLHGTHEHRENDTRIGPMPELREGHSLPTQATRSIARHAAPLRGVKRQVKLPNGRVLEARLEEILADRSSRLNARINRPGGKEFLPLLEVKARPGQAFIVAGQSYQRGILVLVIKVLK